MVFKIAGFKLDSTRLRYTRAVLSRVDMGLSYATTQDDVKYGVAAGYRACVSPTIHTPPSTSHHPHPTCNVPVSPSL